LSEHFSGQADSIPLFRMLKISPPEILRRAESLVNALRSSELSAEIIPAWSVIGGGTTPKARLQSYAVALRHSALWADALLRALRYLEPPVIGRISDDRVLLDLRTVEPEFDATLASLLTIQFESSSPQEQPAERS
jgi:L-seryl-tRNA(Ser) seleniumtransferase